MQGRRAEHERKILPAVNVAQIPLQSGVPHLFGRASDAGRVSLGVACIFLPMGLDPV